MRTLVSCLALLLLLPASPRANELPPLATAAKAWAAGVGHGAVATAEKRDGTWAFGMAGAPFATPRAGAETAAEPPAEKVLFEIGSISKVFTGLLLARAVHDGKLSLDDTLAMRLPVTFDHAATGAITLRQLATHSSCLPRLPSNMLNADGDDPYAQYDHRALFEYLAHARIEGTPPCAAEYSNLGFGILGVVLERAWGEPWTTLVREQVTSPLGMVDTVADLSPDQQARRADPWAGEKPAHPWTFKAMAGAGALRSTLADMSRFADALLAGPGGPFADTWPIFAGDYCDMPALGGKIGLAILHAPEAGEDSYFHDGGTGGYRAAFRVYPASGRAVIVLASNAKAAPEAWLPAWRQAARPATERKAIPLSTEALDEYAGVYAIDGSSRFTLLRVGDGLVARLTGQGFSPVFASAKDEFFYKIVDAQLSFRRDAAGKLVGLTLHQNGRDIPAERSAEPAPHVEFPDAAALAELAGNYDFGAFMPGAVFSIKAAPGVLTAQLTGQPALPVFCTAKDTFDYDVVAATITFERDAGGKVTAAVLHQNGATMRAPRTAK